VRRTVFVEPAPPDVRQWRSVAAYDDDRSLLLAVNILECGHKVRCSRQPGGRKVVGHQEPCPTCEERPW
jgi:hypothetical protein